ncbi:MAG: hypothetical protein ACXAC7_09320 [Candidatus Hodarchaeales archaeon]|jgi:hypothetical protein
MLEPIPRSVKLKKVREKLAKMEESSNIKSPFSQKDLENDVDFFYDYLINNDNVAEMTYHPFPYINDIKSFDDYPKVENLVDSKDVKFLNKWKLYQDNLDDKITYFQSNIREINEQLHKKQTQDLLEQYGRLNKKFIEFLNNEFKNISNMCPDIGVGEVGWKHRLDEHYEEYCDYRGHIKIYRRAVKDLISISLFSNYKYELKFRNL